MAWNTCLLFLEHVLKQDRNYRVSLKLHRKVDKIFYNSLHTKPVIVLGIESSCDDTGCAIVDDKGNILGEALNSQHQIHLNYGGIIPALARDIHRKTVTTVCEDALKSAKLKLTDVDAIATTVKPGLPMSLEIGTRFGKYLAKIGGKPFIPIHHMEAHALMARMTEKVEFPYLVLLISGGHCLLAIVNDVDKFILLGNHIDNAPGEVFDKAARRMKLRNISEYQNMSGGQAIETAALKATNIEQFSFVPTMAMRANCNFSFSGILSKCVGHIIHEERKHNIVGDMIIPDVYNLCAAFQYSIIHHVCRRVQRGMEFIDKMSLIPKDKRTLVISGGVACNNLLAKALEIVSSDIGYRFVRTPPRLCTDNGVMIAWNGVERWSVDKGVIRDQTEIQNVSTLKKAPLGEDWRKKVADAHVKCTWVKVKKKLALNS